MRINRSNSTITQDFAIIDYSFLKISIIKKNSRKLL